MNERAPEGPRIEFDHNQISPLYGKVVYIESGQARWKFKIYFGKLTAHFVV